MALVAAAGRGPRLGPPLPKVLFPLDGRPLLEWLGSRLSGLVGSLVLVLSPDGAEALSAAPVGLPMPVTVAIQANPTGMADAILAAESTVLDHPDLSTLVVLWGDQIGIQRETVARALAVHACHDLKPAITVPLARVDVPYVHYEFDAAGRLLTVRQRREGDVLPDAGLADCGCFVISPGVVFSALRRLRLAGLLRGKLSNQENFLQALPFVAREASVIGVTGASPADTIGLNSPADLERLERATDGRRLPGPSRIGTP
jgi:bifunctional N-acetylglucosamine-1-phosphate-uridyltransferase/glucosamine-1-phosphate-acetyltransferase GlmU-like protein